MHAGIVTVGNEILSGNIVNSDLKIAAEILLQHGITVIRELTVKDDIEEIASGIQLMSKYADIIVVTGGLGPTSDDVTRQAIANYIGTSLEFRKEVFDTVITEVKNKGISDSPLHKKYGYLPATCIPVENHAGLAPGIICRKQGKIIIVIPGPPRELQDVIYRALKLIGAKESPTHVKIYRTFGIREAEIFEKTRDIEHSKLEIGYYPSLYGVKIKVTYHNKEHLDYFDREIKNRLKDDLYSSDDLELQEVLGQILKERHLTIGTAESCTGGLLSSLITDVSGSSSYFIGTVVAYSNRIKKSVLECNANDLETFGAVSSQIASQMAEGIRRLMDVDIGLSTTGIAGPTGGSPQKPVGLVYIGCSYKNNTKTLKRIFNGNRKEIKKQSALTAIDLARRILNEQA